MPLGPKEVRIASPTAYFIDDILEKKNAKKKNKTKGLPLAAVMLDIRTSIGFSLSWNLVLLPDVVGFATCAIMVYLKGERKKKKLKFFLAGLQKRILWKS